MFKIASVSGAPPQTPLGSLRRSLRPPSREGLLSFGTRCLTYSRVLISIPASRSQVFPSRLTGLNAQFCGADKLWILLYTLYSPNLCFRAFCYFMNPASNKNLIHVLFFDSREGVLAFGNRSFAPSALALSPNFSRSVPSKVTYRFSPLACRLTVYYVVLAYYYIMT